MEYSFGGLAPQVTEARQGELLAIAERERRGAAGRARPARWNWRVLAGFGARLIVGAAARSHGLGTFSDQANSGINPVRLREDLQHD